jgi:hypothetical protein
MMLDWGATADPLQACRPGIFAKIPWNISQAHAAMARHLVYLSP